MAVKPVRRRLAGIDKHQAVPGLHSLEAQIGGARRRAALGFRAGQSKVDENAVFLDRVVEQRQLAVAVAEEPQHRRHFVDRLLQWSGRLDMSRAQRRARVDEIAQYLELQRRVPRTMAAVGQELCLQFPLDALQSTQNPLFALAERGKPADQTL